MPPDNGQFLTAAYAVASVIYVGYVVSLVLRAGKVSRFEKKEVRRET